MTRYAARIVLAVTLVLAFIVLVFTFTPAPAKADSPDCVDHLERVLIWPGDTKREALDTVDRGAFVYNVTRLNSDRYYWSFYRACWRDNRAVVIKFVDKPHRDKVRDVRMRRWDWMPGSGSWTRLDTAT